uniref:histidine kinase n=2 Tax=Flavobacterium sp. TaxID=239 RepID=UPI00404B3FF1
MRTIYFIWILLLTNIFSFGQELLPYVENFTKADYDGDNQVWSGAQGADNALYFANNSYLLRYNGVVWEKHTLPNKTIIRSVFVDGDKIYCGSYNEFGFWTRKAGKMYYHSLSKDKALFQGESNNEEIWKIVKIEDKIYFQSFNELFIYKNDAFLKKIRIPFQISYCFEINKKLYVASVNNGVFIYENDSFQKINSWDILEGNIVHAIEVYQENLYVFTQKSGVFVETNGFLASWNNPLNESLKKEIIITAKKIGTDKLAIGTAFNGLYVVDLKNNTYQNFSRANAINNNSVLSILADNENDIWLGLDNGISHIEINSPYTIYSDKTGILGSVYAISPLENGYLLGSNHGVFKSQDNNLQVIPKSQGQVWGIQKIDNQYIIGHNDGTFSYQNDEFTKLNNISGGWKFYESKFDRKSYQANYSGIIVYDDPINFETFTQIKDLTKPIKNIAQNQPNEIWAADNYRGLFRVRFNDDFSNAKVENITQLNGITNDFGVKLFMFKNELFFYINNIWYQYNAIKDKLERSVIFNKNFPSISDISPIDDNRFLLLKDNLLYIIFNNGNDFEWKLIPEKYYAGKIINNDTKVFSQDQKLLINLDDGFLSYDINNENQKKQGVTIEAFYNGDLITKKTKIKFNQPIEIQVLSEYFGFNRLKLFYKLNDAKTFVPIQKGKIILNNLNSGNQDFKVYFHNGLNYEKVADFNFNINKPWYISVYMILIYLLLISICFYLYYRWNAIRYREKLKLKEEELKHQNEIAKLEIDAENKLKIQEYEKHILEIQVQTKASEVAGKSLSIAKQSEMIESIEQILSSENDINQLKSKIKKSIKTNSINKNEWQIFEKNLMKSHEDFVQKLTQKFPQLSSKDIKLCIYLRMNLASKEMAPLMNISYRGVELHRYRLRKKMNLDTEVNLSNFMINL